MGSMNSSEGISSLAIGWLKTRRLFLDKNDLGIRKHGPLREKSQYFRVFGKGLEIKAGKVHGSQVLGSLGEEMGTFFSRKLVE